MSNFVRNLIAVATCTFRSPLKSSVIINRRKQGLSDLISPNEIFMIEESLDSSDIPEKSLNKTESRARKDKSDLTVSHHFKLVFITLFTLSLVSLLIAFSLSFSSSLNDQQKTLFATCLECFKLSFVGGFGLLGGKAFD
jgi:hypothetical protein